jgi:large subunit ribosomal protein L18e
MSVSRLAKYMNKKENKIAVVVANVLDDKRLLVVPKLNVCALKFSESARKRILAAGG